MKNFKETFDTTKKFFTEDLWVKDITGMPLPKRMLFSFVRIIMIVARGFSQDNCTLQASALTYITLVSLVPILAIMFSFTKGLGMQKRLFASIGVERQVVLDPESGKRRFAYKVIQENEPKQELQAPKPADKPNPDKAIQATEPKQESAALPPADKPKQENSAQQPADKPNPDLEKPITAGIACKLPGPMQEALMRIFEYVDNTNFATLGLVGSLMLLVSVICSMAKLENSFNLIWGVKQPRSLLRKCSEYLVVLIMIPIIFLFTTSLNSIIFSNRAILYLHEHYGAIASVIGLTVKLISLLVLLATFGLFFMFMPNTKVKPMPAFLAGSVSFILWLAVQWAYMRLQVGLTNYNAIYGTFAVIPFFLAWLYANWSIILLGGEISFALQNHKTMHLEKAAEHIGTGTCIVIGQLLLFEVCNNFHKGKGATTISEFCLEKSIPARSMRYVVDTLCKAGILVKTAEESSEMYMPGKDITLLSPADVEEAFRQQNSIDTRSYVRDLPEELRNQYEATYMGYKSSLEAMTFYKFLLKAEEK
ncbi:MAG: YihY/virulence factor BrkB family protein [Victivallales bacterium]|nr:YihY/virulence factor BrkB family protein [Victivallales bacterium]